MTYSKFGQARAERLREAKKAGHTMVSGSTAWKRGPWDVTTGEHYSQCADCDYELSMHESNGTVHAFHFLRINAGEVREIEAMPKCREENSHA